LIDIFEHDSSLIVREGLPGIFVSVGPAGKQAIPCLLRGMTSTNDVLGRNCADALGQMRAHPDLIVPPLINLLHGSSMSVRLNAVEALGMFGTDAKAAIPALSEMLKGPDTVLPDDGGDYINYKEVVADVLREIDPEAASNIINSLNDAK
jgi:HEAT repeat protein